MAYRNRKEQMMWDLWAVVNGKDQLIFAGMPSHTLAERLGQRLVDLGFLLDGYRLEKE